MKLNIVGLTLIMLLTLGTAVASGQAQEASPAPEMTLRDFIIGAEDQLSINVWREGDISRDVSVRPDGKISIPLIGDVVAAGLTPKQLEAELKTRLADYIQNPEVTVIVREIRSRNFVVMGEVARPGTFPLMKQTTVLQAIATAGGLREFAKLSKIYVLRKTADGNTQRFGFNYKQAVKGKNPAQNITLEPADIVVVP